MLHRISVTKFNDLSKEQKLLHQYPCAQDEVKKLLILIMNRTIAYKVTRPLIRILEHYIMYMCA